ncbi:unnamed protein product [Amoebophrya sp. A25]|nr:unnamed protein product [Amoebophrya sp. A25]|eukprot:GSA25T00020907001.1
MRIEPLREWCEEKSGVGVQIDPTGKTGTRKTAIQRERDDGSLASGMPAACVLYGKQQLGNFAEGRYAEVILKQNGERATQSDYHAGGILVGLTRCSKEDYPDDCRSIFHVPDSWVLDVYGDLWRIPKETLVDGFASEHTTSKVPDWDSYALMKDGDRIGLLLRPDGTLKVYWNGRCVGDLPVELAVTERIHLIVEILGRAEAVTINTAAKAPEIPLPPGDEDD